MNYGCEDAADALAAYALDALTAAERLLLIEHLAECREHDAELAGYRVVTSRLPLLAEMPQQPAGLKGNLLAAFDREVTQGPSPVVAMPSPVTAPEPVITTVVEPVSPKATFFSIFRQPSLAYGVAAALLIAVVSLAAWNFTLQDDGSDVMTTAAAGPGMSLQVSYYAEQGVAVFDVDMPEPTGGQVYQAWMIADGKPVSLGVLERNRGRMAFAADMSHAGAVAISLEPAGGSASPTQPIVEAKF